MGFASPDAVLDGLSAQFGVPPTRVNSFTVTADAVPCLSEKIARKYTAVPLLKLGSTLVVAVADPADLHAMDDLRFAAGCEIRMMIGLEFIADPKTKREDEALRDQVMKACFEQGVLTLSAGPNALRLAPPLILTREQADIAVRTLANVIGKATA